MTGYTLLGLFLAVAGCIIGGGSKANWFILGTVIGMIVGAEIVRRRK